MTDNGDEVVALRRKVERLSADVRTDALLRDAGWLRLLATLLMMGMAPALLLPWVRYNPTDNYSDSPQDMRTFDVPSAVHAFSNEHPARVYTALLVITAVAALSAPVLGWIGLRAASLTGLVVSLVQLIFVLLALGQPVRHGGEGSSREFFVAGGCWVGLLLSGWAVLAWAAATW